MFETSLIVIAAAAFLYALLSRRLTKSILTAPLAFLALGWALSGLHVGAEMEETLHLLAEVTLVVVLFADAAQVDAAALLRRNRWPSRMLLIGLPLAVVFGTVAGLVFLPGWPFWEVAVLAAILAPTDAALGQSVVSNTAVPAQVRRALVAESGLNDGFALPLILFLSCVALGGQHDFVETTWLWFAIQQIGLGLVVGAAVGFAGGYLLKRANAAGLAETLTEGIAVLALAALSYLLADLVGGNGFIAAFVGGLAFGRALGGRCTFATEFLEGEGRLLILASFLAIGLFLLPEAFAHAGLAEVGLVLASLFLGRPAAIWLSLIGSDADAKARLFMGWFGPRGLATALFALLVLDRAMLEHGNAILAIAALAVGISAVLHGVTAAPLARRYDQKTAQSDGAVASAKSGT